MRSAPPARRRRGSARRSAAPRRRSAAPSRGRRPHRAPPRRRSPSVARPARRRPPSRERPTRRRCCAAPAGNPPARTRGRRRPARRPTSGGRGSSRSSAARSARRPGRPAEAAPPTRAGEPRTAQPRPDARVQTLRQHPARPFSRPPVTLPPIHMHSRQPEPHPAPAAAAAFSTREILGVPVAMVDYDRTIAVMDRLIERRERGYVCAAPVHALMVAQDDPDMLAALRGSTMVVPDGMPVVWAANLLGAKLTDRVYGPELMLRYSQHCAHRGHRVWLYGGRDQGTLVQLALLLRRRHSGIRVVGG